MPFEKHITSKTLQVCLVSDPRPSNPYGRSYSVDCLGNMVYGEPVVYNNQPIETLISLARYSTLFTVSILKL